MLGRRLIRRRLCAAAECRLLECLGKLLELDLVGVALGCVGSGVPHQGLECNYVAPALSEEPIRKAVSEWVRRERGTGMPCFTCRPGLPSPRPLSGQAAWRNGGDNIAVSVDWEQAFASGHVLAACSALLAGAGVLLLPKGTHTHRVVGTVYVLALLLVNVAALSWHRETRLVYFTRGQSPAWSRSPSGFRPCSWARDRRRSSLPTRFA